ncbi:MAG TPA: alkaline phosphatase family protein [Acidobacteriaceae bacterium]
MKLWNTAFVRSTVLAVGVAAAILIGCSDSSSSPAKTPVSSIANGKIRHVWVITLENENYTTTFASNTKSPYLAQTLTAQGALLQQYFGTGHVSLDNYIAMMSGQAGTPQTIADCQTYQDYKLTGTTSDGQAEGTGCVYPATVKTLADQLTAANFTWRGYMGDMGNDPARESATCGHPTINTADLTQVAEAPSAAVPNGDQYATRHNPFMYFHSITDSPYCATNVVNLDAHLQSDLGSAATTPNFSFITPSLCDDGHDAPCVTGAPGGLTSADAFLKKWIPIITSSPAYQADGLIIINFDESGAASTTVDAKGNINVIESGDTCCGQQPGPNLGAYPMSESFPYKGGNYNLTYQNFGGDRTGAVLLSPFIKAGTVSTTPYNHYSLLKTLEDIFVLQPYLGYAGQSGLQSMGSDIFTNVR